MNILMSAATSTSSLAERPSPEVGGCSAGKEELSALTRSDDHGVFWELLTAGNGNDRRLGANEQEGKDGKRLGVKGERWRARLGPVEGYGRRWITTSPGRRGTRCVSADGTRGLPHRRGEGIRCGRKTHLQCGPTKSSSN
jgi:hypothetical protein